MGSNRYNSIGMKWLVLVLSLECVSELVPGVDQLKVRSGWMGCESPVDLSHNCVVDLELDG